MSMHTLELSQMSKRKSPDAKILYVEIVLDNGAKWRIDMQAQTVQEIENLGGQLVVRGPVSLRAFLEQVGIEKREREERT